MTAAAPTRTLPPDDAVLTWEDVVRATGMGRDTAKALPIYTKMGRKHRTTGRALREYLEATWTAARPRVVRVGKTPS